MKRVLLALSVGLAFSQWAHAASDKSIACPQELAIGVDIGQIEVTDSDDQEFVGLSHLHLDGVFELTTHAETCVMLEKLETDAIAVTHSTKRRYLEIKTNASGAVLTIDTYTNSGKLYSIVAQLNSDDSVSGDYGAYVVERSGTRRYLGQAQVSVNELQ